MGFSIEPFHRSLLARKSKKGESEICPPSGHLDVHTMGFYPFGVGWCDACGDWWYLKLEE